VGNDYTPVQNIEAFEFFQPALDAGLVTLESAGSLFGGSKIWVLAKSVNSSIDIVKDDPVNCYALLANSHDGKSTIYCGSTAIRVVCNNTLTAARTAKSSQLLKLRHTKNVHIGLKELQTAFNFQRMEWAATAEAMQRMAAYGVDQKTINAYVKEVFEPEVSVRSPSKESAEKSYLTLVQKIQPLMEHGRGNDNPNVRGTMWGLYNGVTEYLSYQKGRETESRMDSNWFGPNKATNQRAFDVAIKMAA
jgi:phage/plasmid-like protein (TIGR03299 family)